MCVMCALVLAKPRLSLVQLSAMVPFPCCRKGLVLVLLRDQSGASLEVSWVRPDVCPQSVRQGCGYINLQDTLAVLSSARLLLAGRACS